MGYLAISLATNWQLLPAVVQVRQRTPLLLPLPPPLALSVANVPCL